MGLRNCRKTHPEIWAGSRHSRRTTHQRNTMTKSPDHFTRTRRHWGWSCLQTQSEAGAMDKNPSLCTYSPHGEIRCPPETQNLGLNWMWRRWVTQENSSGLLCSTIYLLLPFDPPKSMDSSTFSLQQLEQLNYVLKSNDIHSSLTTSTNRTPRITST